MDDLRKNAKDPTYEKDDVYQPLNNYVIYSRLVALEKAVEELQAKLKEKNT